MKRSDIPSIAAAMIALGGVPLPNMFRKVDIDPRVKGVKRSSGLRPVGQATPEQQAITTGPKRGKGTRKQRKNRK